MEKNYRDNFLAKFINDRVGYGVVFKKRLFHMTCFIGILITAVATTVSFFSDLPYISKVASVSCLLVIMILAWLMAIVKDYNRGAIFLCGIVNLVIFPIIFFYSGGMYGGMPIYFVLGVFFIAVLTEGMSRKILFVLKICMDSFCLLIGWNMPETVVAFNLGNSIRDIAPSVIIASLGLYLLTVFIVDEYTKYYNQVVQLNEKLDSAAKTDYLTKLLNRSCLMEKIVELVENDIDFHIGLFDLDDFKRINDDFGHRVGDNVIISFAGILKNESSKGFVGRYGGEEFIMIIPNITDEKMVEIAERVRVSTEEKLRRHCRRTVTTSIGIYKYFRGETPDEIVNNADQNMYKAKKAGKNCIVADMSRIGEGGSYIAKAEV